MRQGSVLEQESGDVGRPGSGKDSLHNDQQRDREQRSGRPPHPSPERQRNKDGKRTDRQAVTDHHRREEIGLDQVKTDERRRRKQRGPHVGEGHQAAEKQQQRADNRAEVGHVIGHRDNAAPHDRRGHADPPQHQRRQRPQPKVDQRDRTQIGRGCVDHLLDHARGGQRSFEAAAADDRLLPHRGPAGEEEEDHQQREEQLDQQMRCRGEQQARHRIGRFDVDRRVFSCDMAICDAVLLMNLSR